MNISKLLILKGMTDHELIQWANNFGIPLFIHEIKKIRQILATAKLDWIVTGVPENVMKELQRTLGSDKLQKLLQLLQ